MRQEASATAMTLTMKERREFYARVVRANIVNLDMAKDGDLIQEITYDEEDGKKIRRIKLPGKRECIMCDAELAGGVPKQGNSSEHTGSVEHCHVITEERRRAILLLRDSQCK